MCFKNLWKGLSMGFRGSPETNPYKVRVRNADGTVNIHCRKCGHFICRTPYNGITQAECIYCERGIPRPIDPREELLNNIFRDDTGSIDQLASPKKKFNFLDMVVNTVVALGFKRAKIEDEPTEAIKYSTSDEESSTKVARRKKREPIFGRKE